MIKQILGLPFTANFVFHIPYSAYRMPPNFCCRLEFSFSSHSPFGALLTHCLNNDTSEHHCDEYALNSILIHPPLALVKLGIYGPEWRDATLICRP